MSHQKKINISDVIAEKSPKLFKIIPGFLMEKFKSFIHQKEINLILEKLENKEKLEFIKGGLDELGVSSKNLGFNKLPKKSGVIIVANHPLGGLDGLALINEIGKYRTDIKFLVNDILSQIRPFKPYFIPINKHGLNSRENIIRLEKLFQSNQCIIIFPSGLVSRKNKRIVEDLEWRKTFVTKAKKYNKPIYPVYISGENSRKFYQIAKWRKIFRLKINIEMFFLVDEMFKQKGGTIEIAMGNSIDSSSLTSDKSDFEWAQLIKKYTYELKNNVNFVFKELIKNEKDY